MAVLSPRLTPSIEYSQFQGVLSPSVLSPGQSFFVLSAKWFKLWEEYAKRGGSQRPEEIDNNSLIDSEVSKQMKQVVLKKNLQDLYDYRLLTEPEWKLLHKWYSGGPTIERKVITEGSKDMKRVEVYPLHLTLKIMKKNGSAHHRKSKEIYVSKKMTIKNLNHYIAELYKFTPGEFRIWCSGNLLENEESTLEDDGTSSSDVILIEKKKSNGSWLREKDGVKKKNRFLSILLGNPKEKGHLETNTTTTTKETNNTHVVSANETKGLCGLVNLGNTCFMNSSLQCLSNTPPLTDFFLSGTYKEELNKSNPIGMKGQVAETYGSLIKQLWGGTSSYISPKSLKSIISKSVSRFEGTNQQDAQELLAFLLDGLHEDLNRISVKPYDTLPDLPGMGDAERAEISWKSHLARNSSVIVDLFQGQLKSTVQCPKCSKMSVTFDPFMYLSLPLREEVKRTIEVTLVLYNNDTPKLYAVVVQRTSQIREMKRELASMAGLNENYRLVLGDVVSNRIYSFLKDSDIVRTISSSDTPVCYEMPTREKGQMYIKVVHRRFTRRYGNMSPWELMGLPFLLFFKPQMMTNKQLYTLVFERCKRFLIPPLKSNNDEYTKSSEEEKTKTDADQSEPTEQSDQSEPTEQSITPKNLTPRKIKEDSVPQDVHMEDSDVTLDFLNLPFQLCVTNGTGTLCYLCDNSECAGCTLPPNDELIALSKPDSGVTITVSWTKEGYKTMWDKSASGGVIIHPSVKEYRSHKKDSSSYSIFDCLQLFTSNEQLGAEDPWWCPDCKEHHEAFKKIEIWKLPQILVIHLKRFNYSRYLYTREKISLNISFPVENFTMSPYILNTEEKERKYDLYAVSNHIGSLNSGHYTAYCKNRIDNNWYLYDDTTVTQISSIKELQSEKAYVLYYQRQANNQ